MKQSKILLVLMAVLTMLIIVGCSNNNSAIDLTSNEANTPPVGGDAGVSDNNAQISANNLTLIDVSHEGVTIHSRALSMDEAAQAGAQYIFDIFGARIDGMYVELEFADWPHMTRALWHGSVSTNYRNTLANRAQSEALNEEFAARFEAGEDSEDIMEDLSERFRDISYTPGLFYFFIDAITGERIDIWKTTQIHHPMTDESIPLHEYIEQNWDGDWEAAFEADIDPQIKDTLSQMAMEYAQRQFVNSTIVSTDDYDVFMSFIYIGGGFKRDPSAIFQFTDNTGREARVTIHVESQTVTAVSTMSNDFIEMDLEDMESERTRRTEESNDESNEDSDDESNEDSNDD